MKSHWKKNIVVFLSSQAISLFGSSLVQYAIIWYITLTTKSGVYATISILCGFLPTFFLSPFAGVWADRYNRKLLIVLADGGIALCTLIMAILFMSGHNGIWLLFVASAIRSIGGAIQTPAIGAMLPDIVPEEQLTKVNGFNSSLQSVIMLASPMLSGVLMGFAPLEYIFFIDVITAIGAIAVMILFLEVPDKDKTLAGEAQQDYLQELKSGLVYIKNHKYLVNFFIFLAIFFFMAAPVAFLTPLQVARNYGDDVWRLTAIEVTFSVGMAVGGLVIAAWEGFKNKIHTMMFAGLIMGICTIVLGVPIYFSVYLFFMGLFGLVMPIFNTPSTVLLQEQVDGDYIGRVFGIMAMISSSVMPLGMLLFGPLADFIKIEWLLLATGMMLIVVSLFLMVDKDLLAVGTKGELGIDEGSNVLNR